MIKKRRELVLREIKRLRSILEDKIRRLKSKLDVHLLILYTRRLTLEDRLDIRRRPLNTKALILDP